MKGEDSLTCRDNGRKYLIVSYLVFMPGEVKERIWCGKNICLNH